CAGPAPRQLLCLKKPSATIEVARAGACISWSGSSRSDAVAEVHGDIIARERSARRKTRRLGRRIEEPATSEQLHSRCAAVAAASPTVPHARRPPRVRSGASPRSHGGRATWGPPAGGAGRGGSPG